tara:strand:+ start:219 stop:488 length:270 start_codon:yes stop_codon:yes gene_type:complete
MSKVHKKINPRETNPFKKMGFIKFWLISTCFYLFFPISLILMFILFGKLTTKQLLIALANDFFQTILIFLIFISILIWISYYYLSGLFL